MRRSLALAATLVGWPIVILWTAIASERLVPVVVAGVVFWAVAVALLAWAGVNRAALAVATVAAAVWYAALAPLLLRGSCSTEAGKLVCPGMDDVWSLLFVLAFGVPVALAVGLTARRGPEGAIR